MFNHKTISILLLGSLSFYFSACGSTKAPVSQGGYYHSGIYFGKHFPPNYQQGIADGCTTAKGDYKKSHKLFNEDFNYNQGWFLGRNRCRPLLVIDKD